MLCSRDFICCNQYVLFLLNLFRLSLFDRLGHWPVPFGGERCHSSEDYRRRMVLYWPIASHTTGKHYGPICCSKAIVYFNLCRKQISFRCLWLTRGRLPSGTSFRFGSALWRHSRSMGCIDCTSNHFAMKVLPGRQLTTAGWIIRRHTS